MATKKQAQAALKKLIAKKVRLLKIQKLEDDKHLVDLQVEVHGDPPPSPIEQPVEIEPEKVYEEHAPESKLMKWLRGLW